MGVTAGIVGFVDLNNAELEGPHFVRLRKADLLHRINGQLTLRYEAQRLTSVAHSTKNGLRNSRGGSSAYRSR